MDKEEIERVKSYLETEIRSEQVAYAFVNNSTQHKYDMHKKVLDYIEQLESEKAEMDKRLDKACELYEEGEIYDAEEVLNIMISEGDE